MAHEGPPPAEGTEPTVHCRLVTPAGASLLAELRLQRRTAPLEKCLLLLCDDGEVRLSKLLADILSPVLRAVVSGPLAQKCKSEYSLEEHSVTTVELAFDLCCGDDAGKIDSENALALLALADELCLESLRQACSEALVECLVTTNAAQLQEAAERYNVPELLAAARSVTAAESNALGNLVARKRCLQSKLHRSNGLETDQKKISDEIRSKIRAVDDQHAHEVEQLFRKNRKAAWTSLEDGFPHPAGNVLYVEPNANNPYGWFWDGEYKPWPISDDEDAQPAAKRPKIGNGGGTKRRQPPKPKLSPRKTYKSIMEAYVAAAPGDVLKLLAGRHLWTTHDEKHKECWGNVYEKSVQIVADDGLASDRVLVGIRRSEEFTTLPDSAIAVHGADVRIAGVTLVCTTEHVRTGYLGVYASGRLWLENCSMRLSSSCERYMTKDSDYEDLQCDDRPEFGHGVSVGVASSCFLRGCVINGAGGAGLEIASRAARVVVESSTITGCASGSTRGAWYLAGECGAVEVDAWRRLNVDHTHKPDGGVVEVVLRKCQIVGNFGPGVSVRSGEDSGPAPEAMAARITLEDCTVGGNDKEPRVRTVGLGHDNAAVRLNQTERGDRYKRSLCDASLIDDDNYNDEWSFV